MALMTPVSGDGLKSHQSHENVEVEVERFCLIITIQFKMLKSKWRDFLLNHNTMHILVKKVNY